MSFSGISIPDSKRIEIRSILFAVTSLPHLPTSMDRGNYFLHVAVFNVQSCLVITFSWYYHLHVIDKKLRLSEYRKLPSASCRVESQDLNPDLDHFFSLRHVQHQVYSTDLYFSLVCGWCPVRGN